MSHEIALTYRETQVIEEVSKGLSNKEIANKLHISTDTVKHHVKTSMRKLGVTSRVALSVLATLTNKISISADDILSAAKHMMIYFGIGLLFTAAFSTISPDNLDARNKQASRSNIQRQIRNSRTRREQDLLSLMEVV